MKAGVRKTQNRPLSCQHWLRSKGLDLSYNDAYASMRNDIKNMDIMDYYYDNASSFLVGTIGAAVSE